VIKAGIKSSLLHKLKPTKIEVNKTVVVLPGQAISVSWLSRLIMEKQLYMPPNVLVTSYRIPVPVGIVKTMDPAGSQFLLEL